MAMPEKKQNDRQLEEGLLVQVRPILGHFYAILRTEASRV